jgi:hypothetical protein
MKYKHAIRRFPTDQKEFCIRFQQNYVERAEKAGQSEVTVRLDDLRKLAALAVKHVPRSRRGRPSLSQRERDLAIEVTRAEIADAREQAKEEGRRVTPEEIAAIRNLHIRGLGWSEAYWRDQRARSNEARYRPRGNKKKKPAKSRAG